jgi:hypothetical protein
MLTVPLFFSGDSTIIPPSHLGFHQTPPEFFSDETTQDNVLLPVFPATYLTTQDCENMYRRMIPVQRNLSSYKQWYKSKQKPQAIASLQYRTNLTIDREFLVDRDEVGDKFFPVTHKQFIDLEIFVGSSRGFHALTPQSSLRQSFFWTLDLRRTEKLFPCRDYRLGIDPTNSLMWIGTLRNLDVWLVLSTIPYLDYKKPAEDTGGSSIIIERARKLLVYLMLQALASSEHNRLRLTSQAFTNSVDDICWDTICDGFK